MQELRQVVRDSWRARPHWGACDSSSSIGEHRPWHPSVPVSLFRAGGPRLSGDPLFLTHGSRLACSSSPSLPPTNTCSRGSSCAGVVLFRGNYTGRRIPMSVCLHFEASGAVSKVH